MKRAIIYYSLSENTRKAAEDLAARIGADLFRIQMKKKMPKTFTAQILYGGMLATFGMKPKLENIPIEIYQYDEIIIGTPIWAGRHCAAIHTLIQDRSIQEKTVAVFTLDGGGENKKCRSSLQKLLPNARIIVALKNDKLEKEKENREQLTHIAELLTKEGTDM